MHNDAAPRQAGGSPGCLALFLLLPPARAPGWGWGAVKVTLSNRYTVCLHNTLYSRHASNIPSRPKRAFLLVLQHHEHTSATHNHSVTVCVPSSCFGNTPHAARADAFCLIVIMIIPSACATACTHGTAEWHVPCPSIILCRAQRRVSADSYTLPPCLPRARAPCNSNQVCPNIVVSSNLQAEDPRPVQLRASRNSCHCLHKLCSEQCAMRS